MEQVQHNPHVIINNTSKIGDWNRLKNRLSVVNLQYDGQKIPKTPGELAEAITELKLTCQSEGIDLENTDFPEKALKYKPLISKLEHYGILQPVSLSNKTGSAAPVPTPPSLSATEQAQLEAHRQKVSAALR